MSQVISDFEGRYGASPDVVVRSPGRVNLMGDHTDYNDGFVLPFAIDRQLEIAVRARSDAHVVAWSRDVEEGLTFDLSGLAHGGPRWGEYLKGVLSVLEYQGPGLEIQIGSDLPPGAGLSSSAALELGVARAVSFVSGLPWDPIEAALLCQKAENQWVGNDCGIMDQLVVACGSPGGVLMIDCRTLEMVPQSMPEEATVVVLDSGTRRQLVGSEYGDRRAACARAAAAYGVPALRDLAAKEVSTRPGTLSPVDWARARHVVAENERVVATVIALGEKDLASVGRLMVESHQSLRDLFAVSTPELDQMVELAIEKPGCFGARMTGAGFGGCVVAIFDRNQVEPALTEILAAYRAGAEVEPDAYVCRPVAGVSLLAPPGL